MDKSKEHQPLYSCWGRGGAMLKIQQEGTIFEVYTMVKIQVEVF
jgi:hypothetical protein